MTQQETRQKVLELTVTMLKQKAYIKGYGPGLFRIMDETHHPITNINNQVMEVLKLNDVVKRDGMIYILNIEAFPFAIPLDVKLPQRV